MSTRSVIARQQGDGWKGRYIHNNGYPSWRVPELYRIFAAFEGDVDRMLHYYLDEHGAWSSIGTDITTPPGYVDPTDGTAERNRCFCHGDRAEDVMDWWISHDTDNTDCEWAYVLNDIGVSVWQYVAVPRPRRSKPFEGHFVLRSMFRWDTPPSEADLTVAECGENFERCCHYASAHFPAAEGTRYSTPVWLGYEPPDWHDVTHVRKDGVTYKLTGSGSRERKFEPFVGYEYTHRWFSSVESPNGVRFDMFTVSLPKKGEPKPPRGVEWIFDGLPVHTP